MASRPDIVAKDRRVRDIAPEFRKLTGKPFDVDGRTFRMENCEEADLNGTPALRFWLHGPDGSEEHYVINPRTPANPADRKAKAEGILEQIAGMPR